MPGNLPDDFGSGDEFFPLNDASLGQLKSKVSVKKVPTGILGKTANYFKNLTKSMVGVTYKYAKDQMPEVATFGSAMKDIGSQAVAAIKGGDKDKSEKTDWKKHIKDTFTDLKKDFSTAIKTGEFGKEEEMDFSKMFGDDEENWDDLGSFDDFGGEGSDGEKDRLSQTLNATSAKTAVAFKKSMAPMVGAQIQTMRGMNRSITNAVMASAKVSLGSTAKIAQMSLAQSRAQFSAHMQSQNAIYNVLSNMYNFMRDQDGKDIAAGMEYRAKNLSMQEDTLNLLKDIKTSLDSGFSINAALNLPQNLKEPDRKRILASGFNSEEYFKHLKGNLANSPLGMITSMGETAGEMSNMMGGNPVKQMLYGALGSIPGLFISKAVKNKMSHMNDIFGGLGGSLIGKMNSLARFSNNSIIRSIASHLGVNDVMGRAGSHGVKDPKGRAVFDNQVHRTIVEVIPGYLSKMLATMSGKEEIYYDMKTGGFRTTSSSIKEVQDKITRTNNSSSLMNSAHDLMAKKGFQNASAVGLKSDVIDHDFKKIKENIIETNMAFEPKEAAKKGSQYREFLLRGLKGGEKSLDYYIKIFHSLKKGDQMAHVTGTNQVISERSSMFHKFNTDDTLSVGAQDYLQKYREGLSSSSLATMHLDPSKLRGKAKIEAEKKLLEHERQSYEYNSGKVGTIGISHKLGGEEGGRGLFSEGSSLSGNIGKIYNLLADGIIVFPKQLEGNQLPDHLKKIWAEREDSKAREKARKQYQETTEKEKREALEEKAKRLTREERIHRAASSQVGIAGYIAGKATLAQQFNPANKVLGKVMHHGEGLLHWAHLGNTAHGGEGSEIADQYDYETEEEVKSRINAARSNTLLGAIIEQTKYTDNPIFKKINSMAKSAREKYEKAKAEAMKKKDDIHAQLKEREEYGKFQAVVEKIKKTFDNAKTKVAEVVTKGKKAALKQGAKARHHLRKAGAKITIAVHGEAGRKFTLDELRKRGQFTPSEYRSLIKRTGATEHYGIPKKYKNRIEEDEEDENYGIPSYLINASNAPMSGANAFSPVHFSSQKSTGPIDVKLVDVLGPALEKLAAAKHEQEKIKSSRVRKPRTSSIKDIIPVESAVIPSPSSRNSSTEVSIIDGDIDSTEKYLNKQASKFLIAVNKISDNAERGTIISRFKTEADSIIYAVASRIPPRMRSSATKLQTYSSKLFNGVYSKIKGYDFKNGIKQIGDRVKSAVPMKTSSMISDATVSISPNDLVKVRVEGFSKTSLEELIKSLSSFELGGSGGGKGKKQKTPKEEKEKKTGFFGHIGNLGKATFGLGGKILGTGVRGAVGFAGAAVKSGVGGVTGFTKGLLGLGKKKKFLGIGKLIKEVQKDRIPYDDALAQVRDYIQEKHCTTDEAAKFLDEMARVKNIPYEQLDKVLLSWKEDKLIDDKTYEGYIKHRGDVGTYTGGLNVELKDSDVKMPKAVSKKEGLLKKFGNAAGSSIRLLGNSTFGTAFNVVKTVATGVNRMLFTAAVNKALEGRRKVSGKDFQHMLNDVKNGKKTAKETLVVMIELVKDNKMDNLELMVFAQELYIRGYIRKEDIPTSINAWIDAGIITKAEGTKLIKNFNKNESLTYGMKGLPDIFKKKRTDLLGKVLNTVGKVGKGAVGLVGAAASAAVGAGKFAIDHIHGAFSHGIGGLIKGHKKASDDKNTKIQAVRKGSYTNQEHKLEIRSNEKHLASMAADLHVIRNSVVHLRGFPLTKEELIKDLATAGSKVKKEGGGINLGNEEKGGASLLGDIGGGLATGLGGAAMLGAGGLAVGYEATQGAKAVGMKAKTMSKLDAGQGLGYAFGVGSSGHYDPTGAKVNGWDQATANSMSLSNVPGAVAGLRVINKGMGVGAHLLKHSAKHFANVPKHLANMGKRIGNIGKRLAGKPLAEINKVEKVGKIFKDGEKAEGIVQKIGKFIVGLFEHDPFKKFIAKGIGKKIADVVVKKLAKSAVATFAKDLFKKFIQIATPIGWAMTAADFLTGMAEANRYFDTGEGTEPNLGMRIVAGLMKALSNLLLGLIPVNIVAPMIYNLIASKETKEWEARGKKFASDRAKLLGVSVGRLNDYESMTWDEKLFGGDEKCKSILGFKTIDQYHEWKQKKYDPSQKIFNALKAKYGGDQVLQEPSTPKDRENQIAFQKEYIQELTKQIGGVTIKDTPKKSDNKPTAPGSVPGKPGAKAVPKEGVPKAAALGAAAAGASKMMGSGDKDKDNGKVSFDNLLNPNIPQAAKPKVGKSDLATAAVSASASGAPSLNNADQHVVKNTVGKGKLAASPIATEAQGQTSHIQQQLFALTDIKKEQERHNKVVEDFMVAYAKSFAQLLYQFGVGDKVGEDKQNKPNFFQSLAGLFGNNNQQQQNNQPAPTQTNYPPAPMPSKVTNPQNYNATKAAVRSSINAKNSAQRLANSGVSTTSTDLRMQVASGS